MSVRKYSGLLAVCFLGSMSFPPDAACQALSRIVTPSDSRMLRAPDVSLLMLADQKEKRAVEFELNLALAVSRAEDKAEALSAPFELVAYLNDGDTRFKLTGGYSRVDASLGDARGVDDIGIHAIQRFIKTPESELMAGVIVYVPTASETSLSHSTQTVAVLYGHALGEKWEYQLLGSVGHSNAPQPDGVSSNAVGGMMRLAYVIDRATFEKVRIQIDSFHRLGARTINSLTAGYEFPISKKLSGMATASRTVTDGFRATTALFNIMLPF